MIAAAIAGGNTATAEAALGDLCRAYWYPLYAFARRRGLAPEVAEDSIQELFARLLARDFLKNVSPERDSVVLLTDSGEIRTFDLSTAASVKLSDVKLQGLLRDYLAVLGGSRSRDRRSASLP